MKHKDWLYVLALALLVVILLGVSISYLKPEDSGITLVAVGDIMFDRDVELMVNENGKGDFRFIFMKISDHLREADILFGNLESVISDLEGEKVEKTGVIVHFKAEPEAIKGLEYAGFDIISVANNHALDYGREVFEDSLTRLTETDIEYVGGGFDYEEAFSVKTMQVQETEIGFLAYTYPRYDGYYVPWKPTQDESGVAVIEEKDAEKIKKDVAGAKEGVDILIVSFHAGKEYSTEPSPFQTFYSKLFIDAGADLVIGHQSHVSQPVEEYKHGWIAYGLGNFVFDQDWSEQTMVGTLLEVKIDEKEIKEVVPRQIQISDEFQPFLIE
jgi:poly-gamma-glutamate synthesis protein (capsule biosynthesis protein)